MSPVALGLDLLLAGLLIAALAVGVRLNARLKTLRDSQAGFAQATVELNQAAARAEAGLGSLRAASEEAHDSLLLRIETARQLATRLEQAAARAERAPAAGLGSLEAARADTAVASKRSAANLASLAELAASLRPETDPVHTPGGPSPAGADPRPASAPRRGRPAFDDDLFEGLGDRPALNPAPPSRRQRGDR